MRSVPSLVDGFKPSQRKVLFCAFKKRLCHGEIAGLWKWWACGNGGFLELFNHKYGCSKSYIVSFMDDT